MNTFSYTRFRNVARWDLTINRQYYLRVGLGLLTLTMFEVLINVLGVLFDSIGLTQDITFNAYSIVGSMVRCAFGAELFVAGYVFHNFVTRQGRLAEMVLPASAWEKIIWHTFFWTFLPFVVLIVAIPLGDIINALIIGCMYGWHAVQSITLAFFDYIFSDVDLALRNESGIESDVTAMVPLLMVMGFMHLLCQQSFTILVNAWRYKGNIIYTGLFLLGGGLALLMLMGTIFTQVSNSPTLLQWIGSVDWDNSTLHYVAAVVFILCQVALIALMWWGIHRLYCRAQLTTSRNK